MPKKRALPPPGPRPQPTAGHRLASDLLVEYLERIGVEVVFGLCGHTVIAVLDSLSRSKRIRFITTRHEQPILARG
jgi:acetolactate synthase-1/2/3 large subunit